LRRLQVQLLVGALLQTSFARLPGPARAAVIEQVVRRMAQTEVWRMVDGRVWNGEWKEATGDEELVYIASKLKSGGHFEHASDVQPPTQLLPQYQFRIAGGGHVCARESRHSAGAVEWVAGSCDFALIILLPRSFRSTTSTTGFAWQRSAWHGCCSCSEAVGGRDVPVCRGFRGMPFCADPRTCSPSHACCGVSGKGGPPLVLP
jgi:hypothetical protein